MNRKQLISIISFVALMHVVVAFPPYGRKLPGSSHWPLSDTDASVYVDPLVFRPLSQKSLDSHEGRIYEYERRDTAWYLLMAFVTIVGVTTTLALGDRRQIESETASP